MVTGHNAILMQRSMCNRPLYNWPVPGQEKFHNMRAIGQRNYYNFSAQGTPNHLSHDLRTGKKFKSIKYCVHKKPVKVNCS